MAIDHAKADYNLSQQAQYAPTTHLNPPITFDSWYCKQCMVFAGLHWKTANNSPLQATTVKVDHNFTPITLF